MADIATRFFAAADSRDLSALLPCLSADVKWTFGNMPTVIGHMGVVGALTPFFQHVVTLSHAIVGRWQCEDCLIVETRARYKDQFGRDFEFPACNLLFVEDGLIGEVRVFVDNHQLFLPPVNR